MLPQVDTADAELMALNAALALKRERWLPDLQRLVRGINGRFGTNFEEIGCAGEVVLQEHDDYDKFAIEIW
jgi:hypothetical protein